MHLFGERELHNFEILAIQEPNINRHTDEMTTYSHALGGQFHVLLRPTPKAAKEDTPRVCFFVNKRLDPRIWSIQHHTRDMSTLTLRLPKQTIYVHNVYNPSPSNTGETTLGTLRSTLQRMQAGNPGHIVVGDFNLHHPLWTDPSYSHVHDEADELINIAADYGLTQLLPVGTTTYEKQLEDGTICKTTIDLVWATHDLSERLIRCEAQEQWFYGEDHIPILTEFDVEATQAHEVRRKQWAATDWEKFMEIFEAQDWQAPSLPYADTQDIDQAVEHLITTFQEAAEAATPEVRISGFSRPGYTPEMADLRQEAKRARRRAREHNNEANRDEFKKARHRLGRESAKLARNLHRERIERGTESIDGFWRATRWARNRGAPRPSFTPTLHYGGRDYETPMEKAQLLREVLHPQPPAADLDDIDNFIYPEPLPMPPITPQEIIRAINDVASGKAPGPDGIPNLVLQRTLPVLLPFLTQLFNDCLRLGYCPEHFRKSNTVILRKPGKADYTDPKSYRPIALLSTLGKALEAAIAKRMSYLVERYGLLPKTHMGGRRGRSCEHAIHLILEKVYAAWRSGQMVATLLTLDVTGAFDHTNHRRLLHNLRKRRVPDCIVQWVASFLTNRRMIITLLEGPMGEFDVPTGIPQGSPLSPILYLFFNADLIEELMAAYQGRILVTGYIDDICILTWSESAARNCRFLVEAHRLAETWEKRHASKFAPKKYHLIHMFSKHRSVPRPTGPTNTSLWLRGVEIKAQSSIRYLGVWLDQHLTGSEHVKMAREKAAQIQAALSSIAGSTWGVTTLQLRRMYTAVLLPQINYGCSAWYIRGGHGFKAAENKVKRIMESIQYQTLYRIAGAFKTTSRAALEICLHVPPPMITLARMAEESAIRILASPLRRLLYDARDTTPGLEDRQGPLASPLQRLEHIIDNKLGALTAAHMETILPYVVSPWWEPPETRIDLDKKTALAAHKRVLRQPTTVMAYTDGSLTDGGVGASVVSNLGTRRIMVGTPNTHTVYAAELEGINAALAQLLIHSPTRTSSPTALILTDNQAAIKSIQAPGATSGQYILQDVINKVDRLHDTGWTLRFQWIPGHEGAPGNEYADAAAKDAALQAAAQYGPAPRPGDTRPPRPPRQSVPAIDARSRRHVLVATCRQRLRAAAAKQWKQEWTVNPHGSHLRRIFQAPGKALLDIHTSLRRAASSTVIQLQTGKVALAAYLGTFGAMESTACPCGLGVQDSAHILTSCPTHAALRQEILWDKSRETDYRRILSQPLLAKKAAQFIINCRILGQFLSLPLSYQVGPVDEESD